MRVSVSQALNTFIFLICIIFILFTFKTKFYKAPLDKTLIDIHI
jgi:hypothetical protein